MKSYFSKCEKDTENINPRVLKTSNGITMILSKCAICKYVIVKDRHLSKIKKQKDY